MPHEDKDTQRQGTVDTTRDLEPNRRNISSQQGNLTQPGQQRQQRGAPTPGGGEPEVKETQRDRASEPGQTRTDIEREGGGDDLPM